MRIFRTIVPRNEIVLVQVIHRTSGLSAGENELTALVAFIKI